MYQIFERVIRQTVGVVADTESEALVFMQEDSDSVDIIGTTTVDSITYIGSEDHDGQVPDLIE